MRRGWIGIYRKLQCHWLWDDKPFSKGQAWIDLLLLANHSDKKVLLGNEIIEVKTGSFITSELKLMERWGWSKTKVRSFLKLLENDGMIVKKTDRKKTTISIEKYSEYSTYETTKRPLKDHEETTEKPQEDTNNNYNNYNNDNNNNIKPVKHKHGEYNNVLLTDEELDKLKNEYPDWQERIERLSSYVASTGKRYKSHYATIRNWARKDAENKPTKEPDSKPKAVDWSNWV